MCVCLCQGFDSKRFNVFAHCSKLDFLNCITVGRDMTSAVLLEESHRYKYRVPCDINITVPSNRLFVHYFISFFIFPRTFDTLRNHPSFYLFNPRGRVLFRSPEEEPSSVRNQQALPNPIRLRKLEHLH